MIEASVPLSASDVRIAVELQSRSGFEILECDCDFVRRLGTQSHGPGTNGMFAGQSPCSRMRLCGLDNRHVLPLRSPFGARNVLSRSGTLA